MVRPRGISSHDLLFTNPKRVTVPSEDVSLHYSMEHVVESVPTEKQ